MSTVVFAILVLVSSLYRPVVENLGCPGPFDSEHLESPTAHVLLLGTEADAREVIEDPHNRKSRYGHLASSNPRTSTGLRCPLSARRGSVALAAGCFEMHASLSTPPSSSGALLTRRCAWNKSQKGTPPGAPAHRHLCAGSRFPRLSLSGIALGASLPRRSTWQRRPRLTPGPVPARRGSGGGPRRRASNRRRRCRPRRRSR